MRPHEAAALAAIRAEYEVPILYTGQGLTAAPMTAIKSDDPAPAGFDAGENLRSISFEIPMAAVPGEPPNGDLIFEVDESTEWRAISVTPLSAVSAWLVVVQIND